MALPDSRKPARQPTTTCERGLSLAHTVYNTPLEHHLRGTLGVRFAERADGDPRLRPVREIVGVNPALNRRWPSRLGQHREPAG